MFPTIPVGFLSDFAGAVFNPPLYADTTYIATATDPGAGTTTADAQFTLAPNGTFSASGGVTFNTTGLTSGNWHASGPLAGIGDDFQARITLVRTGGDAPDDFTTNNAADWSTINVNRTVSVSISRDTPGAENATYDATIEIRRLSDSAVVSTGVISFSLIVDKT